MAGRQVGFLMRLSEVARWCGATFSDSEELDEIGLKAYVFHLLDANPPVDILQFATDITNYAIMRLSFIDCEVPRVQSMHEKYYFRSIVAAALFYRNCIWKHLRLHAPMKVDERLFEEVMADMTLNALREIGHNHYYVVACAAIVSAAHFYFERGIPEYVGLCRRFLAKFMSGDEARRLSDETIKDGLEFFKDVDIAFVRNALLAPYGARNLATHYQED